MPEIKIWAPLYKAGAEGKTVLWLVRVEPTGGEADIIVSYGFTDGKMQEKRERISRGKNVGRSNATSPFQQAVLEAEARWKKQLERKGYGLTAAASATTRSSSPMLAYTYADYAKRIDWNTAFGQPKLDGYRGLSRFVDGRVALRSREGKPILTMPHVEAGLLPLFQSNPHLVLDGELYLHENHDFNKLASAIKKDGPLTAQVCYHVYDQVAPQSFERRHKELRQLLAKADAACVRPVETIVVDSEDELLQAQQRFLAEGYEGAMLRWGVVGYEAGKRSSHLLKKKDWLDADFKIVDVKEGRGTYAGMAVCTCETARGDYFDVLAPGSHAEKKALWQKGQKLVGKMMTVKYFELSKTEEPVPRFPVGLRILDRGEDHALSADRK